MAIATMLNIMDKLKVTGLYTLKYIYIYSILLSLGFLLPDLSFNNISEKVKLDLQFFTNMYSR